MTKEELNYIKDAFSQIIDDIAGNPDWHKAARAVASDLGTLERKLEEKVSPFPSNLDEAAEEYADIQNKNFLKPEIVKNIFKAGAKWMAGQGGSFEDKVFLFQNRPMLSGLVRDCVFALEKAGAKSGENVVVQIRKKYE